MKLSSVLVLLLIFLTISCRKDEKPPYCEQFPDECVDITGVKDYFAFNVGSYWVYEEEFSGAIDCVYVTSFVNDPSSYYFRTETKRTIDDYGYYYSSYGGVKDSGSVRKNESSVGVKVSKGKPGNYLGESGCFFYYPNYGDFKYTYGGGTIYGSELKSYGFVDITEMNITNAAKFHEDNMSEFSSREGNKFFKANIGLVKLEFLDTSETWRLVDYHISQ